MAARCLPDFEFVFVEGGDFMMGNEVSAGLNELPEHLVRLSDFYIGKFPVTQRLWQAVMNNNPSHFKGELLPVESVSWEDTQKFLTRLNARPEVQAYIDNLGCTGKQFRLPTEAEWEYAARGGKYSRNYIYSGSSRLLYVGWYVYNSNSRTHIVGTLQPNELGICDMSGNVFEWCSDWWSEDYYTECLQQGMVADPAGPIDGTWRSMRGGNYYLDSGHCRSTYRDFCLTEVRYDDIGFRLAI